MDLDPSQEGGPSGGPGEGGIRCLPVRLLWLGRRDLGGCWGESIETGDLSGQGVVLLGPCGDQRSQGSIGGEDAVVPVAVDAGRGEDGGEPVQELESRETQRGSAGQVGSWEEVEDLVGTVADQVEPFEGERGPGAIADQSFEARAVGGLDPDSCVETEPTAVIPGEHILGLVGFQESVAAEVAEHPASYGVLEALQELVGEGRGFVEAEVGGGSGWILIRVTLEPFEEPIDHAEVEVKMGIQGGAEAVEEAYGAHGGGLGSRWTGLPQGGVEGPEENMQHGAGGSGPVMEEGPKTFGHGEDPLAHRHVGEDVVHQVGGGLGHALGVTGGAGSPALAGKRDPVALHLSCTGYNVGFD